MNKPFLVFDIETILDPELPIAESTEAQKLPSPPHHKVVVIGALLFTADYRVKRLEIVGRESTDEAEIVGKFAELVDAHKPDLITYNGRGFDLPVVASRCLRHGVPFPGYYKPRDMRYRFSESGHFDLMDFLSDYGAAKPTRLDVMAKLVGMPGKVGVDGKDVGPLVHQGRIDEVRAYCLCDVVQTSGVFLRVQLLRGEISREVYLAAMRGLIDATEAEQRVEPVFRAMSFERLLLGQPRQPEGADRRAAE